MLADWFTAVAFTKVEKISLGEKKAEVCATKRTEATRGIKPPEKEKVEIGGFLFWRFMTFTFGMHRLRRRLRLDMTAAREGNPRAQLSPDNTHSMIGASRQVLKQNKKTTNNSKNNEVSVGNEAQINTTQKTLLTLPSWNRKKNERKKVRSNRKRQITHCLAAHSSETWCFLEGGAEAARHPVDAAKQNWTKTLLLHLLLHFLPGALLSFVNICFWNDSSPVWAKSLRYLYNKCSHSAIWQVQQRHYILYKQRQSHWKLPYLVDRLLSSWWQTLSGAFWAKKNHWIKLNLMENKTF